MCFCGDICCGSCGPAQGNWRCPICREWASEGCEHVNPKTGKVRLIWRKQVAELERQEREADRMFDELMDF